MLFFFLRIAPLKKMKKAFFLSKTFKDCTSIENSYYLPLVSVYFITLNRARGMSFNGIISFIPILFLHFYRGLLYNGYPAISWHAVQSDLLIRPGTKKSLFCGFPMLLCKLVLLLGQTAYCMKYILSVRYRVSNCICVGGVFL